MHVYDNFIHGITCTLLQSNSPYAGSMNQVSILNSVACVVIAYVIMHVFSAHNIMFPRSTYVFNAYKCN